jgi:hypothetical protein
LKSPEFHTRKKGTQRLGRVAPDDRLAEVVATLLTQLEHDDQWLVSDSIKALDVWKSPEAVPALIRQTSDNRFLVRHEAIKDARGSQGCLGQYRRACRTAASVRVDGQNHRFDVTPARCRLSVSFECEQDGSSAFSGSG